MIGKLLPKGGTIGIISPSSPETAAIINSKVNDLESLGYKIKLGKHIYDKTGFLAGNDKDRAQDLMDMFANKEVDMILCMRGGYGALRLMPYINYNIIKTNPKIFMGYSDITILLNNIYENTGLITFHGPMLTSNIKEDKYTLSSFSNTTSSRNKPYYINNPNYLPVECSVRGLTEGVVVGGNLCTICSTIGTPFEINTKDKILFLEEVGESPYKIDRMLTQLLQSNKLQECRGFILGQFTECGLNNYKNSLTLDEVIEDRIFSLKKPTIKNFMSGHSYPNLTLPIGANVRLDSTLGKIFIQDSVLE